MGLKHVQFTHLQPGLGIGGALVLAAISFVLGSTALAWAQPLPQPFAGGAPVCYATFDEGNTVFGSADAQAVQDAVAAVGAGSTIKLAGTCAGVIVQGEVSQTVYLTQALTLAGGYTVTNWAVAYPLTQPTVLDAQGQGRVILADAPITLTDLTVQNGWVGGAEGKGGGLFATQAARLEDVTLYNNVAGEYGGGAFFAGQAQITRTQFVSNAVAGQASLGVDGGGGANFLGATRIVDSVFMNNTSTGYGGGLLYWPNSPEAPLELINTRLLNNIVAPMPNNGFGGIGGGAYVIGRLYMTATHFISNTGTYGGGLAVGSGVEQISEAHILDATFERNVAAPSNGGGGSGGGAYFLHATVFLTRALFLSNTAEIGGGAEISFGSASLVATQFIGNVVAPNASGSAIYVYSAAAAITLTITNCLFVADGAVWDNVSIFMAGTITAVIQHATIVGPAGYYSIAFYGDNINVTNTLIAGYDTGIAGYNFLSNVTVVEDYNLFMNVGAPYAGNVTSGGHSLIGTVTFANPAAGDYGLVGWSPAIDTGTNTGVTQDFEGDPRPQGAGYDIGYDEAPPTLPPFRLFAPWTGR